MNTQQTIAQLRPEAAPLDSDWSARTLRTIISTPDTARSHRLPWVVGLTTAALLGTGGVAYAVGGVPEFISAEFDWISSAQVHDERRVASFTLAPGATPRTFEVWRAENASGETCTVVLEADGRLGPTFGGACGEQPVAAWFGWTSEAYLASEPTPSATLYVYGEPADPDVRRVRVRSGDFTHTVDVDRETGGYAVAMPEVTSDWWTERAGQLVATVDFLNAGGVVLATHTLRDR